MNDNFGCAVSLSVDGNTLAAGAINEDSIATGLNGSQDDNSASSAGAVYIYQARAGLHYPVSTAGWKKMADERIRQA